MSITFQDEIASSTPRLQELVARVLESACHGPAELSDICQKMRLSRKLAWQARRFAYCTDPFRAASMVPSASGIRAIVSAAKASDVDDHTISELQSAAQAHDAIVERHAGDRATLDVLAANCAAEPDCTHEAQLREHSFRGNSYIWGIRTRVFLSLGIFMPSPRKEHWLDYVQVRGLFGLQRMRPNVRWTFNQSVALNDDMSSIQPSRVPLDEQAAAQTNGVPVFARHCTSPMSLERRLTDAGLYQDEIVPGPVGQLGQERIVTAEVMRDLAPAHATTDNEIAYFGVSVRIPIQTLVIDQFVHRSMFQDVERTVRVFNEVTDQFTIDDMNILPCTATVERLGPAHTSSRLQDIARYSELLRDIYDCLDQPLNEFVLYRTRLEYPPMPSSVMVCHELPASPNA